MKIEKMQKIASVTAFLALSTPSLSSEKQAEPSVSTNKNSKPLYERLIEIANNPSTIASSTRCIGSNR